MYNFISSHSPDIHLMRPHQTGWPNWISHGVYWTASMYKLILVPTS